MGARGAQTAGSEASPRPGPRVGCGPGEEGLPGGSPGFDPVAWGWGGVGWAPCCGVCVVSAELLATWSPTQAGRSLWAGPERRAAGQGCFCQVWRAAGCSVPTCLARPRPVSRPGTPSQFLLLGTVGAEGGCWCPLAPEVRAGRWPCAAFWAFLGCVLTSVSPEPRAAVTHRALPAQVGLHVATEL